MILKWPMMIAVKLDAIAVVAKFNFGRIRVRHTKSQVSPTTSKDGGVGGARPPGSGIR